MKKMLDIAKKVGIVFGVLLMLGFGIGTSKGMPPYAEVYVDDSAKLYIAPPCLKSPVGYRLVTVEEARKMNYNPETKCRNSGAFMQEGRSLTGLLLQKIGVLNPIPDRWNKDGSWNY